MLKKFLIATFSSLVAFSAVAATGESSNFKMHGDWGSGKVCFLDGCAWRALTTGGAESLGLWFFVTYYQNGSFDVTMQQKDVSLDNVRTWNNSNKDYMRSKVRIDKGVSRFLCPGWFSRGAANHGCPSCIGG